MTAAIETHNLVKKFGKITAVDGLSLCVEKGEIYAFLGLNGAGKTTTIRMLLGMIKPTSGEATVLGKRIHDKGPKPWHSVGYLVETADAYPDLTVRQNLEVMRRLRPGVTSGELDEVMERLDLTRYASRWAGKLSHGNKQRLGLAKAMMHKPELLILDEPAIGLDPAGIVEIRHLLLELTSQGVTIFMSSHVLAEVARLAQRIGIIHQGILIQELEIAEIERNRRQRLLVKADNLPEARQALRQAGYAAEFSINGVIEVKDERAIRSPDKVATLLVNQGLPPTLLLVEEEELEHYFLRLIGQEGRAVQ